MHLVQAKHFFGNDVNPVFDNKWVWVYNTYMNSKNTRKRRTDRNQVIYYIQNVVTHDLYVGLTALTFKGNVKRTLYRRMQKHMQRAMSESKVWALSNALRTYGPEAFVFGPVEIVRGKKPAHIRETELIKELQPNLNTFGVK